MDVDLLSKMLKELILDNDRVGLPGVGTFVAEVVPSVFSDKGYTINPPYRKLYFRSKLENEDLVVELYAKSNSLDLDIARRVVTDFALELKSVLHSKKTLALPGLGRLRATKENNIFFIADEDLDIYPNGFGLEPISLKTNQETPQEVAAAVEGLKSILTEPSPTPEEEIPSQAESPEQSEIPSQPETTPQEAVETSETSEESATSEDPKQPAEPEAATPEEAAIPEQQPTKKSRWLIAVLSIVLALALLLLAYMVVAQLCPEFIDKLLYTEDELRIINSLR
jgi:nucleoid DNA-binding protein